MDRALEAGNELGLPVILALISLTVAHCGKEGVECDSSG